jgi:hypothetical protein
MMASRSQIKQMADPVNLVDSYLHVKADDLEACPFPLELAEHIEAKRITLLGIAKQLGETLVEPDDRKRARGSLRRLL